MLNNANKANGYTEVYYNFNSRQFFTDAVGNQFQQLNINLDESAGGSGTSNSFQVVTSLPTTDLSFGDICALTTDSSPYFYDGTDWRKLYLEEAPVSPGTPDPDWNFVLFRVPFNTNATDVKSNIAPSTSTNWTIVGSPSKYGSGSVRLQGDDQVYWNINLSFLTDEFTIEFWIYFDQFLSGGVNVVRGIFNKINVGLYYYTPTNTSTESVTFGIINTNPNPIEDLEFTNSTSMNTQTWYHLALVRNEENGQVTLYINGNSRGTVNGNNFVDATNQLLRVGDELEANIDYFIDDLRISSIERYTDNFTPPTAELPTS